MSDAVAFYGLKNYWSVEETDEGYEYTAELTPDYFYDKVWVWDFNGKKTTDFSKSYDVPLASNISFEYVKGAAGETLIAKCVFGATDDRNAAIESLIKKQGEKPVAGTITAPPTPTPAPTPIPTPDPTPTPTPDPNAPKVGTKLGDVLYTDIKAYINGQAVPSYNIGGSMYVLAADLRNYGFDVTYDDKTRSTTIKRAEGKAFTPLTVAENGGKVGSPAFAYLYTDIKTYINGKEVTSRNVNNKTAIPFGELRAFGAVSYDDAARSSRLTLK